MYYFTDSNGKRYADRNLSEVRRTAIWYLKRLRVVNVLDIKSDMQGYMGNIYKPDDDRFIWSPANGKRLEYKDQTYLGYAQHYVGDDGELTEKIENPIAPFNVYRYS